MPASTLNMAIGLSGVAEDETPQARRWAKFFELPMILLAIWILVEWYVEAKGLYPRPLGLFTDWVIWLFFITETVTLTVLVRDKGRYLRGNWMNLLIIAMGIPILWGTETYVAGLRTLRMLLILPLLANTSGTVRRILMRNHLGATLLVTFVFTLMAGLLVAGIDPSIETVWEGIWWAWVTVATVGYGDIVPESPAGKVFGAILILFGVGFFSLLTANFSAYFVSREEAELKENEQVELDRLKQIERRIEAMEQTLERIESHLKNGIAGPPPGRSG